MTSSFTVPTANGVYTLDLGSALGQVDITIACGTAPSAGALKIDALAWTGQTVAIGGASALNLADLASGNLIAGDYGHYRRLIFTITGVTGSPSPLEVVVTATPIASPVEAFFGLRAAATQTFTETNTKYGRQQFFRISKSIPASGGLWYIGFQTGAVPVLVRARDCYAAAESLALSLFRGATYTGGSAVVVQNFNDYNPIASTVSVSYDPTVTSVGTQWGGDEHIYGSNATSQRFGSGLPAAGIRILAPNTKYLIRLTNSGAAALPTDYFLSWTEGFPDLPRR